MENALPYVINFSALLLAAFGVYRSVVRDYERERDERRALEVENAALRNQVEALRTDLALAARTLREINIVNVTGKTGQAGAGHDVDQKKE